MHQSVPQRPEARSLKTLRKPARIHVISDEQGTKLMTAIRNRDEFGHVRKLGCQNKHEDIACPFSNLWTWAADHTNALLLRKRRFARRVVKEHCDLRR
jgi:hypothetical protein